MFGSVRQGRSDDRTVYAPTYYPGTPSIAEAQRVTVGIGQEAQNITFNLTTVPVARVYGHGRQLLRPTGGASVRLTSAMPGEAWSNIHAQCRERGRCFHDHQRAAR